MDLTVEDKQTPDIQPLPKSEPVEEKKKKKKEEHNMTDKRKAALAKARAAQKAKRELKKKQEEEDRVGMKTLHGLVQGLHARLDSLEKKKLMEQKQVPVRVQPMDTPLKAPPKPPALPRMAIPEMRQRAPTHMALQTPEKTGIERLLSQSVRF